MKRFGLSRHTFHAVHLLSGKSTAHQGKLSDVQLLFRTLYLVCMVNHTTKIEAAKITEYVCLAHLTCMGRHEVEK